MKGALAQPIIHVTPFADLRQIDIVQVLTRRGVAQQAAELPGTGG